jgi:hypothetical protein
LQTKKDQKTPTSTSVSVSGQDTPVLPPSLSTKTETVDVQSHPPISPPSDSNTPLSPPPSSSPSPPLIPTHSSASGEHSNPPKQQTVVIQKGMQRLNVSALFPCTPREGAGDAGGKGSREEESQSQPYPSNTHISTHPPSHPPASAPTQPQKSGNNPGASLLMKLKTTSSSSTSSSSATTTRALPSTTSTSSSGNMVSGIRILSAAEIRG